MGLLLSILVFSVGVLEALACVRHIQQGILPAWAPRHVTSASGRRLLREHWRKSTSQDDGDGDGGVSPLDGAPSRRRKGPQVEELCVRPRPPPLQLSESPHHVRSPDIHWPELVPHSPVKTVQQLIPSPVEEVPGDAPTWPVNPPDPASLHHTASTAETLPHEELELETSDLIFKPPVEIIEEFVAEVPENIPAWPVDPPDPASLLHHTSATESVFHEVQHQASSDSCPHSSTKMDQISPLPIGGSIQEVILEVIEDVPSFPVDLPVLTNLQLHTSISETLLHEEENQVPAGSPPYPPTKTDQETPSLVAASARTWPVDPPDPASLARRTSVTETLPHEEHGQARPLRDATPEPSFASEGREPARHKPAKASSFEEARIETFQAAEPKAAEVVNVTSTDPSTRGPRPAAVRGRMHIAASKDGTEDDDPAPWPIINIDTVVTSDEEGDVTPPSNLGSRRVSFDPVPTVVVIDNEKPITEERERGTILAPSFMITDNFEGVLRKELPKVIDDIIQEAMFKVNQVIESRQNGPQILEKLVGKNGNVLKGALASVCAEEYKDRYEPDIETVFEDEIHEADEDFVINFQDQFVHSVDESEIESNIGILPPPAADGKTVVSPTFAEDDDHFNTTLSPSGTDKSSPVFITYSENSSSGKHAPFFVDNELNSSSPSNDIEIQQGDRDQCVEPNNNKYDDELLDIPLANELASTDERNIQDIDGEVHASQSPCDITNETNDLCIRDDANKSTNEKQRINAVEDSSLEPIAKEQSPSVASPVSSEGALLAEEDAPGLSTATTPSTPVFSPESRDEAASILPASSGASVAFSEIPSVAATAVDIPFSTSISPNSSVIDDSIPIPCSIPDLDARITSSVEFASVASISTPAAPSSSAISIAPSAETSPITPTSSSFADTSISPVTTPPFSSLPTPPSTTTAAVFSTFATPTATIPPSAHVPPISHLPPIFPAPPALPVAPATPLAPASPASLSTSDEPLTLSTSLTLASTVDFVDSTPPADTRPTELPNSTSSHSTPVIAPSLASSAESSSTSKVGVPRASKTPVAPSSAKAFASPASPPLAPAVGAQLLKETSGGESSSSGSAASANRGAAAPTAPQSEAFWLIFSGEYTKAMSKDWHSGHFCCWQCDESLTGQRYVLRDDHPYCIKCYESVFANVCEECNRTIGIDSKDLSYKDKHWHEACFLCTKCRVSLVDKQFGSKADKIYCGNCYDAQFASRCDGCGEIFRAGTKKMEYKTRQWHEKCFCCCVCKTAIGTKSFIPREQEIYCAGCYEEKFATRCVKCNKIITSGGVTYKNEPWHRECFTCTHCNTSLAGQRFTSRDEKPYCADCFGELFAKRCTSCSKPITGIGGTRFISFEDRHWHNDCFICASCKTSLVGRGFITDADDIICPECAKQKLM